MHQHSTKIKLDLFVLLIAIILISCSNKEDNGLQLRSVDDLQDKRIGVVVGFVYDKYVKDNLPGAKVLYLDQLPDIIKALEDGKCDATFATSDMLPYIIKEHPTIGILQERLMSSGVGFGFNFNNPELLLQFNEFLAELRKKNELETIYELWTTDPDNAPIPVLGGDGSSGTLRFGTTGIERPISFVRDGQPAGYDIDLFYRFATKYNYKVKIQNTSFGGLIAAIESGKVDVIGCNIFITPEREKHVAFSDPYATILVYAIALKKNIASSYSKDDKGFKSAADLADKRIGVLVGSVYENYAILHYPKAIVSYYDTRPDVLVAIENGKCDGAMFPDDMVPTILREHPNISILEDNLIYDDLGFAFAKSNKKLLEQFNTFIRELQSQDELKNIYDGWRNNFNTMPDPVLKGDGSAGTIILGTTGIDIPNSIVRNGVLVGYDIDIFYRFASRYNYKVVVEKINFGGLIAALTSGKIDVIGSGMIITPERSKMVNFSEPYAKKRIAMLALKKNIVRTKVAPSVMSIDYFKDKTMAVLSGSIYEKWTSEYLPNAKTLYFDELQDVLIALKNHKADATFVDEGDRAIIMGLHPEIVVYVPNIMELKYGIGINKNNNQLLESINEYISDIKANGELEKINDKWLNYITKDVPAPKATGKGDVLRIGVVGTMPPSGFIKNDSLAGYDIEILYGYANTHNLKVEVLKMNFASLMPALVSGRVDAIAAGISITPEREKQIAFTIPYMTSITSIVGLKENIAGYGTNTDEEIEEKSFFVELKESVTNNLIAENRYLLIVKGLKITFIISILSTILGTLLGAIVCYMKMSSNSVLKGISNVYITILRGTPILVLLMIMYYVIFAKVDLSAIIVAIIAFAMNFAAYVSEMFRTSIESVNKGQTEAGIAMGFTKAKTFLYIVMPQAIRRVLPVYKGEFISLVKSTSIVGYIAIEDLTKASDIIRSRTFDAFFPLILVALFYFALAYLFLFILNRIEINTDSKHKLMKRSKA
ncbi:MAG: ABC transporter permease subunit [Ignavibacteria bacterium]|jgi:polar amino acid transport system substrate-binding protein|nr:ABC transporter permease subunit [Ignavibacteria bacterium]